jgi:predicted Zn-dependent peptidase
MTLRYPVNEHRLANGMRVLVSEDRLTPVAALHLHHDARDQRADPAEHYGRQPAGPAEYDELLSGSTPITRSAALPGCAFHYGRLDPSTISMIMWAEADAVSAAGGSVGGAVLAVTGDVSTAEVIGRAELHFGKLPGTSQPASIPVPGPALLTTNAARVPWPMTALGFRLPAYSLDGSYFAAELALRIIADGPHSRAHRALVQVTRTASQVFVRLAPHTAAYSRGLAGAWPTPGSEDVTAKLLAAEFQDLIDRSPGAAELAAARDAAEQDALRFVASAAGRALHLACLSDAYASPSAINQVDERIRSVTSDQAQHAAASWLDPAAATPLNCQLPWEQLS